MNRTRENVAFGQAYIREPLFTKEFNKLQVIKVHIGNHEIYYVHGSLTETQKEAMGEEIGLNCTIHFLDVPAYLD